jgi:hypothetical protein
MYRVEIETRLRPAEVIEKAVKYFGGLRLDIKERSPEAVYFEGGGGVVEVTAAAGKDRTTVEFFTTEWEAKVKDFIDTF